MEWARLAARVGAMIVRPGRTFDEVGPEAGDLRTVLWGYVAPLAAIPAVCSVLGGVLFGISFADVGLRQSLASIVFEAGAGYGMTLVSVWLLSVLVSMLAPAFGGWRDREQALKLVGYSGTAMWVAGVAHLYPNLALPAGLLAALWSGHTFYVGLPKLMRCDPAAKLTYFAVILLGTMTVGVVHGMVVAKAAELGGPLTAN